MRTCLGCNTKKRLTFGTYGKKFCSIRCAADWADGMTESSRYCVTCGNWSDVPAESAACGDCGTERLDVGAEQGR
jgi:hypothetical protein